MLRKLLIFGVLLSGFICAQDKTAPIFLEHNSIIDDTTQVEIISYRIPYNNLLFIKNDDTYTASFTLILEFYKNDNFVSREIIKKDIYTKKYQETLSEKNYYQDLTSISLDTGNYILKPILSLESTDLEYKIPNQKISIKNLSSVKVFDPIIVIDNGNSNKSEPFVLVNYGNVIPFSNKQYQLLIGVNDSTVENVKVSISQFKEKIFSDSLSVYSIGSVNIDKNNSDISVSLKTSNKINFFKISNFSHLLSEGISKLIVSYDTTVINFTLNVSWLSKPKVLNNPEYSIKLLGYLEDESSVADLLSASKENYYKNLANYWKENYPADGMKYNFAMEEFYSRADYAIKNYSSLNTFDGAERDRGRIYILYGKPSSIERNYTEMNEIVEIWKYDNIGRIFIFKDVSGTGKFDLTE